MLCMRRFLGKRAIAGAPRRCIWAEASRRLRRRKKRRVPDSTPSGLSFCWRSQVYTIAGALQRASTRPGLIVMCRTGRRWTCWRDLRIRLSDSLPAFATAFWRDVSFLLRHSRKWTPILWGGISEAACWTYANFCFVRRGGTTRRRRAKSIFAPRQLHQVEQCTACADTTRRRWHCRDGRALESFEVELGWRIRSTPYDRCVM